MTALIRSGATIRKTSSLRPAVHVFGTKDETSGEVRSIKEVFDLASRNAICAKNIIMLMNTKGLSACL